MWWLPSILATRKPSASANPSRSRNRTLCGATSIRLRSLRGLIRRKIRSAILGDVDAVSQKVLPPCWQCQGKVTAKLTGYVRVSRHLGKEKALTGDGHEIMIFSPRDGGAPSPPPAARRFPSSYNVCFSRMLNNSLCARPLKKVQMQGGVRYEARGVRGVYVAAPREHANAADGPFSAAC